jgi:hypothetical protein
MWRRSDLVRTDVSKERIGSIRVERISELGTLAVTSDTFLRNVGAYKSRTA